MAGRCHLTTGPYQARTYIDFLRERNRYFDFINAHTFVRATLRKSLILVLTTSWASHEYSRPRSLPPFSRPVLVAIAVTDRNKILSNHEGYWRCSFSISALAIASCDFGLSSSTIISITLTPYSVCAQQSKIAHYVQEPLSTL